MTMTTYDIIMKNLDRIAEELQMAEENSDFSKICFYSGQIGAIKENLKRLLWIEHPELNDGQKYEVLSQSTTKMYFNPGIFELDAMRQAFFKRQAKAFFNTEEKQQAYINFTEEQYLGATIILKEFQVESNKIKSKMSYQERKARVQAEFVEAMK